MNHVLMMTVVSGLFLGQSVLAQISIREGNFSATGVSDEGVVVGHIGENSPYYLWDSRSGSFQKIGGLSAGNNVGGWGSISADGRYVSGSMACTKEIDTQVQRVEVSEKYQLTQLTSAGSSVLAIGKNAENKEGIIVQSFDKGRSWKQVTDAPRLTDNGLESICFLNDYTGLIGGWDGIFLYTTNSGNVWYVSPVRPGKQDQVKVYRALSSYGINQVTALAELQDGTTKVYFSTDGAESWSEAAKSWEDEVVSLANDGKQFYLTTSTGAIYQSKLGDSWTLLKSGEGNPLNQVAFYGTKGMAAGTQSLYCTEDGTTWKSVAPDRQANYTSILWRSNQQAYVTTDEGYIYQTKDGGETWEVINERQRKEGDRIVDIQMLDLAWVTCGSNSTFFTQSFQNKETIYEMARYDAEADEWMALGGLGAQSGQNSSSGYFVSGDGQTVGGLAHKLVNENTFQCNRVGAATVWEASTGTLTDLGSRLGDEKKNSRIEGLSADGSVAVGFKENRVGFWEAAVWHKDAQGNWDNGKYLLADLEGGEQSNNILYWGNCISPNGKWIGGSGIAYMTGPLATGMTPEERPQPYLWNEEQGVTYLGMMEKTPAANGFYGFVQAVNDEGTVAVGTYLSAYTVPAANYPFIWTKEEGMQDLNDFVKKHCKENLEGIELGYATDLSDNGRYISGCGLKGSQIIGFVIDLEQVATHNETPVPVCEEAQVHADAGVIRIQLPEGMPSATAELFSIQGQLVRTQRVAAPSDEMLTASLPQGTYVLRLTTSGQPAQSFKLQIK